MLSDLYGSIWAGEGSQSPNYIESGERAGGEEGARQHHRIPLHYLQTGFSHGHPERSCARKTNESVTHLFPNQLFLPLFSGLHGSSSFLSLITE